MLLRIGLCYALCATIAASPKSVDAFVSSSRTTHYHHLQPRAPYREGKPTAATVSSSVDSLNVLVDSVVDDIDELYPPQGLDQRIALSRKDGYWPFITAGEDPPQEYVYGEFDIGLLEESLERSRKLLPDDKKETDIVFCDLGSGTGRLLLAAAALHPDWKLCRGIEYLETIHQDAVEKLESCRQQQQSLEPAESNGKDLSLQTNAETEEEQNDANPNIEGLNGSTANNNDAGSSSINNNDQLTSTEFRLGSGGNKEGLPLAPIELECGSYTDPYSSFCDADILFCFSTCLSKHLLIELARSVGRQSPPGTIVITTDYQLPSGGVLDPLPDDPDYPSGEYEIELVDTLSGTCNAVGGESTVYIQRVVKSVGTGTKRVQPALPVSEIAYRAIQYMEENDSTIFLRQVSNQMAFLGFPESWRPKI